LLVVCLFLLTAPVAWGAATPEGYECYGPEDCKFKLDEKNFQATVAKRISNQIKDRSGTDRPLPLENVKVLESMPFAAGGYQLVAVKFEVSPLDGQGEKGVNFVVVDPSGSWIVELTNLGDGKNMGFVPVAGLRRQEIPADLGQVVFKGQGQAEVVMFSDPICSFCQMALQHLIRSLKQVKEIRLVHFPLANHIGADTACSVLIYAEKNQMDLPAITRFAYEYLDPSDQQADKSGQIPEIKKSILAKFMGRFPDLAAKLGADPALALAKLEQETAAELAKDRQIATDYKINATPVIFINGLKLDGYRRGELDAALALANQK
jgi:protein-disulfide isomerase